MLSLRKRCWEGTSLMSVSICRCQSREQAVLLVPSTGTGGRAAMMPRKLHLAMSKEP